MSGLSKREVEFLHKMMESKEFQPISYYAEELHVSTKTLQSDLKEIRKYLEQFHVWVEAATGKGILLSPNAKGNVDLLNELKTNETDLLDDAEERRSDILQNLLIHTGEKTSILKMSEKYYVSKTSIVNDMKWVEEILKEYHLTLEKTKEGTYVSGKEADIRKAIADYSVRENAKHELFELFEKEDVVFVERLLKTVDPDQANIGDIYYTNLLTHILICVKRVSGKKNIDRDHEPRMIQTNTLREYQKAKLIAEGINEHYHIQIGEAETYYIYQYLVASGIGHEKEELEINYKDITIEIAEKLTAIVAAAFSIDFYQEKDLMEGLVLHIRPMLNRVEYDLQITNPLLDEIKRSYPNVMECCVKAFDQITEEYHLKKISEDEIAYIVFYYEAIIEKLTARKKVLVVCHSGYGTSQLLAARIKNEFPNFEIVDVVSSRKVEEMELEGIDYIIATVSIKRTDIPYALVSALLTEQDVKVIRNIFMGK
ncbi:MAG: transcription antiterminator [Lachnospiraceae bacterium]|nr:transcription antiterminator [Lachnospiraceae bacterium]